MHKQKDKNQASKSKIHDAAVETVVGKCRSIIDNLSPFEVVPDFFVRANLLNSGPKVKVNFPGDTLPRNLSELVEIPTCKTKRHYVKLSWVRVHKNASHEIGFTATNHFLIAELGINNYWRDRYRNKIQEDNERADIYFNSCPKKHSFSGATQKEFILDRNLILRKYFVSIELNNNAEESKGIAHFMSSGAVFAALSSQHKNFRNDFVDVLGSLAKLLYERIKIDEEITDEF